MKIALIVPDNRSWVGPARCQHFIKILAASGHDAVVFPCRENECPAIAKLHGFDLICNHAMQAPPEMIRVLAESMPDVAFVNINHSAIAHLERLNSKFCNKFTASIHSARQVQNVWYASQDPMAETVGRAAHIDRAIWLPVPGHILEPRPPRPPNRPANVVIAGRDDPIKNNLIQVLACGLLGDQIQLVACVEGGRSVANTAHALGLPIQRLGLLDHADWLNLLGRDADVVLCVSHAESYGFVAAEAMQMGVPVVASDAIRFADPDLVVSTGSPEAIAAAVEKAIGNYAAHAAKASQLAREAAEQQASEYVVRLQRIRSATR